MDNDIHTYKIYNKGSNIFGINHFERPALAWPDFLFVCYSWPGLILKKVLFWSALDGSGPASGEEETRVLNWVAKSVCRAIRSKLHPLVAAVLRSLTK